MSELLTADTWIRDALGDDATIAAAVGTRIYADAAPESASFPLIVFASTAPFDVNGSGAERIAVSDLYRVVVVGQASGYKAIEAVADRIDAVLNAQRAELDSGRVFSCVRESPVRYQDEELGLRYFYLGGLYRVLVH